LKFQFRAQPYDRIEFPYSTLARSIIDEDLIFVCFYSNVSLSCSHTFPGPFARNLKITQPHPNATNVEAVNIDFQPSNHSFAGIAENFPKLKVLNVKTSMA
jgi:hypothetical protein